MMLFRAKRTSEHAAIALFVGIILFFLQSFICTTLINNTMMRSVISIVLSVIRLGVPAWIFAYMQKSAGFEECKINVTKKGSVIYNLTLAFAGFSIIFVLGILYSAAFPMAAVSVGDKSVASVCVTIIGSAVVPAVFEECLYRRFLCKELTIHGGAFAVIISSLLFALAHFSFNNFPYAFVCGLVLGVVYIKTGSVKYTIAIHFANNFLGYVLSLIGSGMNGIDYMNMMVLIVIALAVMTVGALYVIFPNKEKFAFCQSGNVTSSAFLTFPMVVYIFCSMLMNFI